MFERYTEAARRVIFFGRYEASQTNSRDIRPDHLVLAILREDAALLRALGLNEHAKDQLQLAIRQPAESGQKISITVDLSLSESTKRVLAYAAEESDLSGSKNIRPGDLLLGVLREDEKTAEALKRHKVDADKVRVSLGTARVADQPQHRQTIRELNDSFRRLEARLSSDTEPAPVYVLSPPINSPQ